MANRFGMACLCGHNKRDHNKCGCEWFDCPCEKYVFSGTKPTDQIIVKERKKPSTAGRVKGMKTLYIGDCDRNGKPFDLKPIKINKQVNMINKDLEN